MNYHTRLSDNIVSDFGAQLMDTPKISQDAVIVAFANGIEMELRFVDANEYAIHWQWQDQEFRIDTAPLHKNLATFPNHLHLPDGSVEPDHITQPGKEPWENIKPLIDLLLIDPALQKIHS